MPKRPVKVDWTSWATHGRWWERLPPVGHPLWKMAQGVLALSGLAIVSWHGMSGGHDGVVDVSDGAGALGLGLTGKLIWNLLKRS